MSIPGTFNSTNIAQNDAELTTKAQIWDIETQFNAGVRYF